MQNADVQFSVAESRRVPPAFSRCRPEYCAFSCFGAAAVAMRGRFAI